MMLGLLNHAKTKSPLLLSGPFQLFTVSSGIDFVCTVDRPLPVYLKVRDHRAIVPLSTQFQLYHRDASSVLRL